MCYSIINKCMNVIESNNIKKNNLKETTLRMFIKVLKKDFKIKLFHVLNITTVLKPSIKTLVVSKLIYN